MEDYMTADDWQALQRLDQRARRGLSAATVSAAQAEKFQRRGYATGSGHGIVVTAAGRTAVANWERSRRT